MFIGISASLRHRESRIEHPVSLILKFAKCVYFDLKKVRIFVNIDFKSWGMRKITILLSLTLILFGISLKASDKINRLKLVTRHNIEISEIDRMNPLTVGNGEFAYTADITGLQTFPEYYEDGIPLGTQSQWGWHSFPNPSNYSSNDAIKKFKVGSDSIPYIYKYSLNDTERKYSAGEWLLANPQHFHLGLIGLEILKSNSEPITMRDIAKPTQKLNLWTGELTSYFEIEGVPVEVVTLCHQKLDLVSFLIKTDLIKSGRLKVKIDFPYASEEEFSTGYDLSSSDKHTTSVYQNLPPRAIFKRLIDSTFYYSQFEWRGFAKMEKAGDQTYYIVPAANNSELQLSCLFTVGKIVMALPLFPETQKNNAESWKKFWESGAAVDFSDCSDKRADELERRVVLSQYLTKIQCTGSMPPQETGLTSNSLYGKINLGMEWWNTAHFIQWGRAEQIEKQLDYYFRIFEKAKATARLQGYEGARWPNITGNNGDQSPGTIVPFQIYQQPHLIYLTDLLYRYYKNNSDILKKYQPLIEATADFMASYARWDTVQNRYMLGPVLVPEQVCFEPETTINPAFELAYWQWGLQTAQKLRVAMGLAINQKWQNVADHLSPLPAKDNQYLFTENTTDSYTNPLNMNNQPSVLGIAGFLPINEKIDNTTMMNTLDAVIENWNWKTVSGSDFPLSAMCATALNAPEKAIGLLMMDTYKNRYLPNGHNYQDKLLPLYLPGNGGLLSAIAFMCTWRNEKGNDGFPANGKWKVKYENFFSLHPSN
jgi:hypothetical protein